MTRLLVAVCALMCGGLIGAPFAQANGAYFIADSYGGRMEMYDVSSVFNPWGSVHISWLQSREIAIGPLPTAMQQVVIDGADKNGPLAKATAIGIVIGTNANEASFTTAMKRLVLRIRDFNKTAPLYWSNLWSPQVLSQPGYGAVIKRRNRQMNSWAPAHHVKIVRWMETVHGHAELFADDGLHPNAKGTAKLNCLFFKAITGRSNCG